MDPAPKSVSSTQSAPEPPSEPYVIKKHSPWPFLGVIFAIIAGIAGTLWYFVTRPDPFKVLVAVDVDGQWWEGSKEAAHVADEVAEGLKKVGFEAVKGGDPKVDKVLEKAKSPEEAARSLGAGFVVVGEVVPEVVEHPVEKGYVEIRAKVNLRIRYVLDDEGKADEASFSMWTGAGSKKEAMTLLADHLADRVFDAAVPRITSHPVIQEKLSSKDIQTVVRLEDAKKYVDLRQRRLDEVKKAYDKVESEWKDQPGGAPAITYHGKPSSKDYLCGVGPEGILVQTQDSTPFIDPKSMEVGWITELETLAWRGADGKDKVLWTGYHLYGYPSVSTSGKDVLFVEDIFGWAKTLTAAGPDGKPKRVLVDPEARFVNPEVAPGGKAAALYRRPCYQCPADFVVVSLDDGSTLFSRSSGGSFGDEGGASFGGYAWLDASRVLYVVEPNVPEDPQKNVIQEVRVVDVSQSPPNDAKLLDLGDFERCNSPSASEDGKRFVMTCSKGEGWQIAVFDPASGSRTDTALQGQNPDLSRDGKLVAYGRRGDIYAAKLDGGDETRLTKTGTIERYPRVAYDGKRVYFESQQEDPNHARRILSVVASVEAP